MQLAPDLPLGRPSFELSSDQVWTVTDLLCRGAEAARADVSPGLLEVPISIVVRKAMRRIKKELGLTNVQLRGEHELEDMATRDAALLGRIDITLQFLHQFGDEDAYVGVESKRIGAGLHQLNGRYVSDGVNRFATGQYGFGHRFGFMLGYVLRVPVSKLVQSIDGHIRRRYGAAAALSAVQSHVYALAVLYNTVNQTGGNSITLHHVLVDMTTAA